jgi:arylsulfatase
MPAVIAPGGRGVFFGDVSMCAPPFPGIRRPGPPLVPLPSIAAPLLLVGVAWLSIASPRASCAESWRVPNVVFVLTDDQGYGELSCHGNPLLRTPHLDRLHAESVRFTDFHVSPTCAPTRCALMTGRHEFRAGVTHTIFERDRMSLHAVTIAQVLKGAGYTTGIFGKWHLGDEAAYQPERRGFDEVFIHGGGGIGQTYPGSNGDAPGNSYFDPTILHNGRFERTKGFCTDVFFRQALQWIDQRRRQSAPFFAYIPTNAPHGPYVCPESYRQLYAGRTWQGKPLSDNAVGYYGMIANIDDNLGRLLGKLREWGLERRTLVIFMNDNGHSIGNLYNAGMHGTKGTPYEGGTRAASFWRWPGTLPSGVDVGTLTAHLDLFPTLAELAGATLPTGLKLDGRSLVPLLKDAQARWDDRLLFTHVGRWPKGMAAASKYQQCAVRSSQYRLVNDRELYDIRHDPGETTNVIEQHPAEAARLRAAYDQWWQEILPALANENVVGPQLNPFKVRYWKQFGGGPTPADYEKAVWGDLKPPAQRKRPPQP